MQEELSLARPSEGTDRLSIRVVIGLGDITEQDSDVPAGEAMALITRIEDITPAEEMYITAAAPAPSLLELRFKPLLLTIFT